MLAADPCSWPDCSERVVWLITALSGNGRGLEELLTLTGVFLIVGFFAIAKVAWEPRLKVTRATKSNPFFNEMCVSIVSIRI